MERTRYLIVGAGVSGLAFADWLPEDDYLIVEAEDEIGGYCRTVRRSGFVWDYSGHYFHFRNPEIERYLVDRMDDRVLRVERESRIWYAERFIDFPFQRNIDQLPEPEYEECARGLRERGDEEGVRTFKDMLYARYGRGIAEKFLVPYNEKLYATNLARLDADAMGRFFPHVRAEEILEPKEPGARVGYNATFTYPEGGAIQYVNALADGVSMERLSLGERLVGLDLERKEATTTKRRIQYDALVSTVPLVSLLDLAGLEPDRETLSHSKVLVFNLGFDEKGPRGVHWIYYPQRELSFYRVGFYDNIFGSARMSLYVEVGLSREADVSPDARGALKARVLADLQTSGIVTGQTLVASHEVALDPAYVHVTPRSIVEAARRRTMLAEKGVHAIGRYGAWTYCSIEDNIVEARALAERLAARS